MSNSAILVTGAAGFIGFHVALRLLKAGQPVHGIDNLNDYYDVSLKQARLAILQDYAQFSFSRADVSDREAMEKIWTEQGRFTQVIHLAAQAGVRYSLENPYSYVMSNCMGHLVMMELCRHTPDFQHLVYASSSSVYGANTKRPYSVEDPVNQPVSLYAATKRADELMSHAYSHLFAIPQTGLRFFTVYGPWGRPDMAPYKFTRNIIDGQRIDVYNHGKMKRDFTYIDDIVDGVLAVLAAPPMKTEQGIEHRILNLGNNRSEKLMDFIAEIEKAAKREADINFMPLQAGDVLETYADISHTQALIDYAPKTTIAEGVPRFVSWYKKYFDT